jgi:LysM repeat protein
MKKAGQKTVVQSLKFMNVRLFYWGVCFIGLPLYALAAPYGSSRASVENLTQSMQQAKAKMMDFKYEIQNHDSEIQTLKEKFNTQDSSIDQLREQLLTELDEQKHQMQVLTASSDNKLDVLNQTQKNLETLMRGMLADLQQIKTQANDSVTALGQYKQKINEIDQVVAVQNQQIQSLETALHSIVDALQIKDPSKEIAKNGQKLKTYKVQPGDSLEKIARLNHLSVQAIREVNQLTSDRIVVGQTLKLP